MDLEEHGTSRLDIISNIVNSYQYFNEEKPLDSERLFDLCFA